MTSRTSQMNQNLLSNEQVMLKNLFENLDSKIAYTRALKRFIQENEIYSKFKPQRRKFKRRKTIVQGPFNTYQLDLSDMRKFKSENKNYRWMLFIIDAFSRYLYILPLKKKNEENASNAIENFLNNLQHLPKFFYHDAGKEFLNKSVYKLLDKQGIQQFVLKNGPKAGIVERVQRTIKTNLEMLFAKNKNHNWINYIQKLVDNYNHRFHRSIGMEPANVSSSNWQEVYKRLYSTKGHSFSCRLKKGDLVRISLEKTVFSKGYSQNFSDELYEIQSVVKSGDICYYIITDLFGKKRQKKYFHQLSLVLSHDSNTPPNKKIRKRRRSFSN